jgi:hypothetical protein
MADTSLGFRYRGRLHGDSNHPTILKLYSKNTATHTKGDLVMVEGVTGEVLIAATNSKLILGVVQATVAATDSTTLVTVIADEDAIYGVYDASARHINAPLDIAGTTGAMTIATDTNHDLLVIAESSATEETLVMIMHGAHPLNVTTT